MAKYEYFAKDGEKLRGVTSIIGENLGWNKRGLMSWAWDQGRHGKDFKETSKEEAKAGTVAHYLIECHIKGVKPDVEGTFAVIENREESLKKAYLGYNNFCEWVSMVDFKPFLSEKICISEKYRYGTRIDCLAFIRKKLSIVDWKLAKDIYADHLLQLAAHEVVWNECNPKKVIDGGLHILKIGKEDASFSHHFWNSLEDTRSEKIELAWKAFCVCLELDGLAKKLRRMA